MLLQLNIIIHRGTLLLWCVEGLMEHQKEVIFLVGYLQVWLPIEEIGLVTTQVLIQLKQVRDGDGR